MDLARPPSLSTLLRGARAVYGAALREALVGAGYDDIPDSGLYVIGVIARGAAPLGKLIADLAVSKQVAGQLVDTLVMRGYASREVDPQDRRRLTITLSPKGRAAARLMRGVTDRLEARLVRRVGAQAVAQTRATLGALIEHGRERREGDAP
jgi:DNA-binding MarR family transcriptional regulator